MHGQDTVTKLYAHVRKDRDSLLQDLISSPEVGLLLLDIPERHRGLVLPGLCGFLCCIIHTPFQTNHVLHVQANGMYLESRLLYSGGRRVYSDFSSGKWLEQTQVQHHSHESPLVTCLVASLLFYCYFVLRSIFADIQATVRSRLHSNSNVLGLIFYSDAAEARRHQHKFHPLLVYIANFTLDGLRSQRGYRRVAYLPILWQADFPTLSSGR